VQYSRNPKTGELTATQVLGSIDVSMLVGSPEQAVYAFQKEILPYKRFTLQEMNVRDFYAPQHESPGRWGSGQSDKLVKFDEIVVNSEYCYDNNSENHSYYRLEVLGKRRVPENSEEYKAYVQAEIDRAAKTEAAQRQQYEHLRSMFENRRIT
jgi:hypothetical protein